MVNNKDYKDIKNDIISDSLKFNAFSPLDKDNVPYSYSDSYATEQQQTRDGYISDLLNEYVESYRDKRSTNRFYRKIIFWTCFGSLLVFIVLFVFLIIRVQLTLSDISIEDVVQLISLCLTFITLIFGILTIITKYVFPENDEEYITRIVESIQKNDLENKKENIKASGKMVD